MSRLLYSDSVVWFSLGLFEKSAALTTVFPASLPITVLFAAALRSTKIL